MKRSQRLVIFLLLCLGAFALVERGFRGAEPDPIPVFVVAPLLVLGGLVLWLWGRRE
jgi:hypothetical protein